jgi:hypothetical protein
MAIVRVGARQDGSDPRGESPRFPVARCSISFNADVLFNRGLAMLAFGDAARAEEAFRRALASPRGTATRPCLGS